MTLQNRNLAAQPCLRFRPDLRCSLHDNDGTLYYLVEDPACGSFYRLGVSEWRLASQLDGRTSLKDAVARLNRDDDQDPMSREQADATARFLVASGLVTAIGPDGQVFRAASMPAVRAEPWGKLNPFFIRVPLICPDRLLTAALPWCRWLISRHFLAVWLPVVIWGGYCIYTQWDRFTDSARIYLAPHTWVYLWFVWCFLKVVHEFSHGLFCKKYGGHVGSAGVALILFSPVAFLDVTSAWRFRCKWQRICTSGAGIYIEVLIAGMAAILWSRLETGTLSHVCHSIVLMASLTTVLFNANPLMRFDGYYILTDLLEIQNLYGAGQQYVRSLLRRTFLGLSTNFHQEQNPARRRIVKTYGVAAAMWRITVCLSMILVASTLFHGAGLLIALLGVVSWVALPCFRLARLLVVGKQKERPHRVRFAVMSAALVSVVCGVLFLPWPGGVSAPATVVYATEEVVRTATAGFVQQVHVTAGQPVTPNQLLVTLRNDELRADLADAKRAVQGSTIRARVLLHRERQAAYQAEREQLAALKKRQAHLQSRVDGLLVRASREGNVLGRRPQDLLGQFVEVGTPLLKVADKSRKEIQLSIPESYVDVFLQKVGTVPRVRVPGRPGRVRAGRLTRVAPRASVLLRNPALGGSYGGPLTVREVRSHSAESPAGGPRFELEAPRFHGVVALPADESLTLRAGQLAQVRVSDWTETLGRRTYRAVKSWVQRKLNQRITTAT